MSISRREWMFAAAVWTELLRAQDSTKFLWFDPATADEIKSLAGEIIPDDDTPGAERAGVIWFIDRALAGYDEDKRGVYTHGLAETQSARARMFPGSTSIAGLSADQRLALCHAIEKTEFFQLVRLHSILGFFGHPKHGGNRDQVGWKLIGVEYSMQYQPPFGYYDGGAQ